MKKKTNKAECSFSGQGLKQSIFHGVQSVSTQLSGQDRKVSSEFQPNLEKRESKTTEVSARNKQELVKTQEIQTSISIIPQKTKIISKYTSEPRKTQNIESSQLPHDEVLFTNAIRQDWLAQMNFPYFFKSLKNHPEENILSELPQYDVQVIQSDTDSNQNEFPLFYRKKIRDKEWRTHFRKTESNEEGNRRKSSRIEQIQQKERLESQMKDMRLSFYRGKYRYEEPSVRFRLSFLEANCQDPDVYQCQTIMDIPDQPLYQTLFSIEIRQRILKKKYLSLSSRIIKQLQKQQ